jgi:hypothetical protein
MRYRVHMTPDDIQEYWALLIASVLATAVLLFVIFRLYQGSARGQLRARVRELRKREQKARKAARVIDKAETRLARLRGRADSAKPRRIDEASGLLADAKALHKIANDQVLIAQNLVRKVIVEEFPPKQHDKMRSRYLPQLSGDKKPFRF